MEKPCLPKDVTDAWQAGDLLARPVAATAREISRMAMQRRLTDAD